MHCPSLSLYTDALERKDLAAVGELMLASAEKLARMGASFVCCPDNTIHSALTAELLARCSVPWLRINVVVAAEAARRQYRRVAVLGTRWLVESSVYVDALSAQGITAVRPSDSDRGECHRIIMNELTAGIFKKESTASLQRIIERMKEEETCDAVLLGCTELPLVLSDANSALPTLDSTRLLAHAALQRAVEGCTAPLNI
jgi:aspartate racemase